MPWDVGNYKTTIKSRKRILVGPEAFIIIHVTICVENVTLESHEARNYKVLESKGG